MLKIDKHTVRYIITPNDLDALIREHLRLAGNVEITPSTHGRPSKLSLVVLHTITDNTLQYCANCNSQHTEDSVSSEDGHCPSCGEVLRPPEMEEF